VEFGHRLYERSYICGTEGNLSARIDDDRFLITPAGVNKGLLEAGDLVGCDMEGNRTEGTREPSTEMRLHLFIYKRRPDIRAVCHAHPLYATSFAVAGIPLNRPILPEIVGTLGIVPLAQYGAPGSEELPQSISEYVERYDAILLKSHGVVTMGTSIEDAYNKMEAVEKFAGIVINAERLGGAQCLQPEEAERFLQQAGRLDIKDELFYGPDKVG
jgi:L-fuculose-phosphate aldolase